MHIIESETLLTVYTYPRCLVTVFSGKNPSATRRTDDIRLQPQSSKTLKHFRVPAQSFLQKSVIHDAKNH